MRSIKLRAIGAIAAGVLLAAGAMVASASDDVKTKVKITEGGATHFAGTVTSKESKCEKRRKVSLLYTNGAPYKGSDVVGTDKTDADGNWDIEGSFTAGLYVASAKVKKYSGSLTCRAGETKEAQY